MKSAKLQDSKVFGIWIGGLSLLVVIAAVIANFNVGRSTIREEVDQHWQPPRASPSSIPGQRQAAALEQTYNYIAQSMDPVTVSLTCQVGDPRTGQQSRNFGSGFFVTQGYVLTNFHVVQNASAIQVALHGPGGSSYSALVASVDPSNDLAVIQVRGAFQNSSAKFGDSDRVRPGDIVMAIGNPMGFGNTLTMGIVADRRNNLTINGHSYGEMIQVDSNINHGSSGGPLVNLSGEVIGVNTALFTPNNTFSGIGFAVPINRAFPLLRPFIDGSVNAQTGLALAAGCASPIGCATPMTLVGGVGQAGVQQWTGATTYGVIPPANALPLPGYAAVLTCPSCQTTRYARCPICQQRMVVDATGSRLVCPSGHNVPADTSCPRCGSAMQFGRPPGQPFSLAV